jgi:hypothetical protein
MTTSLRTCSTLLVRALCVGSVAVTAGCVSAADDAASQQIELAATQVPEAPAPGARGVSFGRDTAERARSVRIHKAAHQGPTVIYSVRVRDLRRTEQLRLRGEVTLSRCNHKDITGQSGDRKTTPCFTKRLRNNEYRYAPRFSAVFVLGTTPTDAKGSRLSGWFKPTLCTEERHHCAVALPEKALASPVDAADRYVNLVVAADHRRARSADVMEVELAHGGLSVTRMAPGASDHAVQASSRKLLATGALPISGAGNGKQRHLAFQVPISGLRDGDVVDVSAGMHVTLGNYKPDPLVAGQIVLSTTSAGWQTNALAVTALNGSNCADHGKGCTYGKSGAVRLGRVPDTMYASYVVAAIAPNGGKPWKVKGGFLAANVRR